MQKKIIALAIASAMTMPALALAEVTVYGKANVAYEMTNDGGDVTTGAGAGNTDAKRNQVSSNTSILGLKGSEDLGNGLTAVWQMEGTVGMDNGATASSAATGSAVPSKGTATSLFNRNTFVGVAGGFGTVVLGQHDTPYKLATRKLDVFADSIADNRSIMGGGHDARGTDVLAYISPNFSGFTAAVAYVGSTDNTLLVGAAVPGNSTAGLTSISGNYARDNWTVALANQSINVKNANPGASKTDMTATKLAGTFAMNVFTVGLAYEMLSTKTTVKNEQNNIYLAGTFKASDAGTVKLAYTMAGEKKSGGVAVKKSEASQVSLGYDHAMTKNTTLFALYTSIGNNYDKAAATGSSYGLTSGSSTGDTAAGTLVAGGKGNPSAIAFGVRHSF